jgi:predicted transcriptional regulator
MSFYALKWGLMKDLDNPTTKLVLVMLCDYANDLNECYPSQQHLAKRCGVSERCIITHIRKLEISNIIRVKRTKNGYKTRNYYKINMPYRSEKSSLNTNIYNKRKNKNFMHG